MTNYNFKINDINIKASITGSGGSGCVLFVHGLADSMLCYNKIIPRLARLGYTCIAPDLPGFGESDKNHNFHSQTARAEILWELLTAAGFDNQPIVLVGHSMGAGAVTCMAGMRPERVRGLCLISPALRAQHNAFEDVVIRQPWFPVIASNVYRRILCKSFFCSLMIKRSYGYMPDPIELEARSCALRTVGVESGIQNILRAFDFDTECLKEFAAPVRVIWGRRDVVVKARELEYVRRILPQSEIVELPEGGHSITRTHHNEIFGELVDQLVQCNMRPRKKLELKTLERA